VDASLHAVTHEAMSQRLRLGFRQHPQQMFTQARAADPSQGSRLASSRPSPDQRSTWTSHGLVFFKHRSRRLVAHIYEVVADGVCKHCLQARNSGSRGNGLVDVEGDERSALLVKYLL
jgi:hypothetical protein